MICIGINHCNFCSLFSSVQKIIQCKYRFVFFFFYKMLILFLLPTTRGFFFNVFVSLFMNYKYISKIILFTLKNLIKFSIRCDF